MGWPDDGDDLPIAVYAAFGADLTASPITWQFTDITGRVRQVSRQITIRRGASDGASVASPGTGTALVGNDDGALTPGHPASQYWPNVDLNTPVAMGVLRSWFIGDSDLFTTSSANSWGLSDRGRIWQTISAGGTIAASDYQVTGGVGTHSVPAANAYRITWLAGPVADVDVVCTVTAPLPTGAPIEPCNLLARITDSTHYYMARLSVATSGAVTASIHASGGTGQLASVVVPGLTWSGSQAVRVRFQCWGEWLRMRVWKATDPEPTAWTLWTESTEFTAAGGVGVRSGVANGNTNTKPIVFTYDDFAATELPALRLDGFADSWEPTYVPVAGGDVVSAVRLTASGLLRRLGQGVSPERSAYQRTIESVTPGPLVYWPMQDGPATSQVGATTGGPLAVDPPSWRPDLLPRWGEGQLAPWMPPVVDLSGGGDLLTQVPRPSGNQWSIDFLVNFGTRRQSPSDIYPVIYISSGGLLGYPTLDWMVGVEPVGLGADRMILDVWQMNADGTASTSELIVADIDDTWFDGQPHFIRVSAIQSGANVDWTFCIDDVAYIGTITGKTLKPPATVEINSFFMSTPDNWAFGHLAVWDTADPPLEWDDAYAAATGYQGETASARIARVCAEEGISVRVDAGSSESMGPQPTGGVLDVLRDAANADSGILSERAWGLRYRPRSTRYNLDPSLTVDLSTYQRPGSASAESVLAPVFDDRSIRNDITASRPHGSFARVRDAAHVDRYGLYDDSVDVNVSADSRLPDQAGWRVWLGIWKEMRYPSLPLHLEGNPDLIDDWLALELGDRVDRINPPPQHPPGPISQIIPGYSEVLAPKAWTVTASCLPYGPWEVAEVDGDERVAADGSTVGGSGLALGAMSFTLVSTAANGTTAVADFPMDLNINGERATASSITGTGLSQTVNLSARGVNGITKAHPVGTPVDVWAPAIVAL